MQLKHYQQQSLDWLQAYLQAVALRDAAGAYATIRAQYLTNKTCIVVSTFASLRVEETEGWRAYDHHEELDGFFRALTPMHRIWNAKSTRTRKTSRRHKTA